MEWWNRDREGIVIITIAADICKWLEINLAEVRYYGRLACLPSAAAGKTPRKEMGLANERK